MAPALYLVIVAVVGLAATVTLRETVGTRLLTEQDIAAGATSTEPEPVRTERA
jgi:hypothetical protein